MWTKFFFNLGLIVIACSVIVLLVNTAINKSTKNEENLKKNEEDFKKLVKEDAEARRNDKVMGTRY